MSLNCNQYVNIRHCSPIHTEYINGRERFRGTTKGIQRIEEYYVGTVGG